MKDSINANLEVTRVLGQFLSVGNTVNHFRPELVRQWEYEHKLEYCSR